MGIASQLLSANFSFIKLFVTKTHLNEQTFLEIIHAQI